MTHRAHHAISIVFSSLAERTIFCGGRAWVWGEINLATDDDAVHKAGNYGSIATLRAYTRRIDLFSSHDSPEEADTVRSGGRGDDTIGSQRDGKFRYVLGNTTMEEFLSSRMAHLSNEVTFAIMVMGGLDTRLCGVAAGKTMADDGRESG